MPWFYNRSTARDEYVDVEFNAPMPAGYERLQPEGRAPRGGDGFTPLTQEEIDTAMMNPVRTQPTHEYRPVWGALEDTVDFETQYVATTRNPTPPPMPRVPTWAQVREMTSRGYSPDQILTFDSGTGRTTIDGGRKTSKMSRDENGEMAVANKEPVPQTLLPNPLANVTYYQVTYSLSLFKEILAAIRNGRSMVPMRFDKPRPVPPRLNASNRHTPKYDAKKASTYAQPFEKWEFFDEWRNKVDIVDRKNVPKQSVDIWEKYRLQLLEWDKTKGQMEEVPIQWVFKFLHNKLTNEWSHELDKVAGTFNSALREHWEKRFTEYNKRSVRWPEIDEALKAVYHHNRWDDANCRRLARLMPPEVRPRRVTNFSGNYFRRYIIEYFQGLYRIKYGEDMPENTLFWNSWLDVVDLGANGVIEVDDISGLASRVKYTVPKRYADEFLVVPCTCCNKIGDVGRMYWVSPKHKDQVVFRGVEQTAARRKKRQEEFLKNYKPDPKKDPKYYTYPSSVKDMTTVPTHIHGIIRFLNDHIDTFDKNKTITNTRDVDEYGINHTELDEKEMAYTNVKMLGVGWADTANRNRYLMVCQTCFQRLAKPEPMRSIDDEVRLQLRRAGQVIRRDRDSVITRHGSSPFDYLGRNYMLARGEQRRFEKEKIFDARQRTFVEQLKDTTLYFGVELEVCPEDDLYQNHMLKRCGYNVDEYGYTPMYNDVTWVAANVVDKFARYHKKSGIITFDRSTGNGFELVTLPGTFRWHMEEAWNGFFKEDYDDPEMAALAPAAFCSGWVNNGQPTKNKFLVNSTDDKGKRITHRPYCGIHIHFSRDAITPLQLGKLKYFINTHTKFIEQIAGRTSDQYARYVPSKIKDGTAMAKNKKGNTAHLAPMEGRGDNGVDRSRYVALNLNTGKPTFELRIFRANVSKAGFYKNLEFTHALIMWCGTAAPVLEKNLTVAAFVNWMEGQRGQYKWLTKWLIHHKYMSSVHKFTPGRTREFDFIDDNIENETTTRMTRRA